MPAYLILYVHVEDQAEYDAYRQRSGATVEAYGGRYLVRGGPYEVIEGDLDPERVVVVEFESRERAHEWYSSPEYQEIVGLRQRAAPGQTILVEGYAP